MDKLKMHSPNLTEDNIARIRDLFPGCVTEARGEDGCVKLAVDFDQLRQELSSSIVEGPQERYHLNWPGKREALLTANAPIAKTLRPVREESVDFDTTKNLFIEGDNLDALKLLQETYLGKVKMIYIDPPYNTGNDFIYEDDFAEDARTFLVRSNQVDDSGVRLVANTDTNGRFHSDWLSMLYPRIKLARTLLSEDGVIFVSADDSEIANLIRICDEIFGEANFVANFIWEKRTNRENRKVVSSRHDYVVCYARNQMPGTRTLKQLPMSAKALANYKNPDNDPRGLWKSDPAHAQAGHGTKDQFYVLTAPNGKKHELESGRCWLYTEKVMNKEIADGKIWFGKDGNGVPRIKTYLDAKERGLTPESILFAEEVGTNESAKNLLKELFSGRAVFDTPKPVGLIQTLIQLSCDEGIILDFFAGSGTTAEAIFELNTMDGRERRFILVQLPEALTADSEAYKAGYRDIAHVGMERIRLAGKSFKGDTGFRVLKIDTSNMADVYYSPDALDKANLDLFVDNIKSDRTAEDLLFQVMLDWGVDLALPIEKKATQGKDVFFVDGNALVACFDAHGGVDETFVKELATHKPLRVVFRDAGFKDSAVKINVEQIFKLLSPSTEVKSI
ncbi:DNA methylase family protein [Bordetella bronchiseptica 980-2]|nr:site-specific DNA-methyltransferase [Bordetella bronchiseptica]KAK66420.1 DNA methylase family protein [Bordetella bronchiseptica 980-2]KCV60212.1 DNA methylase family protein [Bordetella bronchiseptica 980]KDB85025.1 DNA methylase family protein [Bordetella bronchiseptica D756]KDB89352.1 DNA methylase family protein [Bordetella bronchiseptica D989]